MAEKSGRFETMNLPDMEIQVSGFAFGGRAVGRCPDGKVCFVRGAVPGETVRVRLTSNKKKYCEGILLDTLSPSPERLQPECALACPGCSYAHVPYTMELEWKQRQFRSFAEKARLLCRPADFLREPLGAPVRTGWRNKIRLSLEFSRNGNVLAGYRGEDNRSLIPVEDCPLAVPAIREALKDDHWRKQLTGKEKNITFRWTDHDGVIFFFDRTENRLLTDELSGFGTFQVGAGSFFQINPFMSGTLAGEVVRLIRAANPELMVELYCGCGCFSVVSAEKLPGLHTFGVELDGSAIRCAGTNAARHGVSDRTEFAAGDSAEVFRRKYPKGLPPNSLLLVDPPRTGLDKAALELIGKSQADRIIYVSCSPDTLFRDLAYLEKHSCRIRESRLLDMFPSTAHFESITELVRE